MRIKEDSFRAAILLSIVILTALPIVVYAQPQESSQMSNAMTDVQAFHCVEPYEPISEILPSEMYTPEAPPPQSPGTITIKGTMKYVSETGAWLPMRQVRVVLMDDDTGPDETVATKYTDYSGYFSFTVNNDDGWFQDGRDPYVKVYSENGAAYCKDGDLIFPDWYVCQLPKCGNNVPDGFTYNYGVRAPASYNEAWQAIDACLGERDWIYWRSSPYWQRYYKAEIRYPKEDWPHSHGDRIDLPWKSTWNWNHATVHHEYAHCVMYALYGHFPSGWGPDPHYVFSESSLGFAMCEGWAEFMQCAVDNKNTNLQDWYNGHGGNIETNDWYNCIDTGTMDGYMVEGSIASVFWDINDGTSAADKDYLSWGFDEIFTVMRYNQPDNINQFWDAWKARWPTMSTSVGPLCTVYWNYGIDKDTYMPHSGSIKINAGATFTKSRYVTLTLSCSDWGSGVVYMRFRNSVLDAWSPLYPYATSKSWTLSLGDGVKYVYVQFKDKKNLAATYYDTIILDTTLPKVTNVYVNPTKFSPKSLPGYTRINFTLSESCYVTIRITTSAGTVVRTLWNNLLRTAGPQTTTWNGRNDAGVIVPIGTYYIKIYVKDRAGNLASPYPIVKSVTVAY